MLQAVEEAQLSVPDTRSRLIIRPGALEEAPPNERKLLEQISQCDTVGELLDTLPATDGRVLQALELMLEREVVSLEAP